MAQTSSGQPLERRTSSDVCVHCMRPIVVASPDPRWNGWCAHCAQAISTRHGFESA